MPAEFRILFNGVAANMAQIERLGKIRVDQAIGLAAAAELHMAIGLDERGHWSGIEEPYVQPSTRVRIEVKVAEAFEPLIEGSVVAQRFELSDSPNESELVLVAHDDSVLLNRNERVELFENLGADQIADRLFQDHGLLAEVDPVALPSGGLPRVVVQRGTAMQLLRELARHHGMFVYVKPGEAAGTSKGMFVRPKLTAGALPEIRVIGAERNVHHFSVHFDGLQPHTSRADSVGITDVASRSGVTTRSVLPALGDLAVHDLVEPGQVLLARTREDQSDLDEATAAAVELSSWAYTARGEVAVELYGAVLSPYQVVQVAGPGGYLGGAYLVSEVTHLLSDAGYSQQFVLRRNARSNGGAPSAQAGGIF